MVGGAIRFENVTFSYGAGSSATLENVSFDVPAGCTVALVGPSGAGKTTIMNLIPRFWDVNAGRVTIDGADVRDVTLSSLRAGIAGVSQDVTLFDDTVRANISYGRPDASEAEIEAVARHAAAHAFISSLPDGYDTRVGERGLHLSAGQCQRLAIARAMLKDAPILLLDEATSSLDAKHATHTCPCKSVLMEIGNMHTESICSMTLPAIGSTPDTDPAIALATQMRPSTANDPSLPDASCTTFESP